jgi:hypothetical protein
MKRAAQGAILGLLAALAAWPARADCADEVRAARQKLPSVKDEARRKEAARLLDKAQKDAAAGRERLCIDAMVRVQALID